MAKKAKKAKAPKKAQKRKTHSLYVGFKFKTRDEYRAAMAKARKHAKGNLSELLRQAVKRIK